MRGTTTSTAGSVTTPCTATAAPTSSSAAAEMTRWTAATATTGSTPTPTPARTPSAPPPNDDFENAAPLSGYGTTVGATKQLGEPDHAGFAGGHSVWFRWTAPRDGRARVSVFTGTMWDSLLGIYTGVSVGALTQVAA